MVLGRFAGEADVVFGAVGSGRPPSFPGVEAMLGMFISTVPVRVRARPDAELLPWLRELQAEQTAARELDYVSVPQLQGWSEVPAGERLWDTLFVFQNLPDVETRGARVAGVGGGRLLPQRAPGADRPRADAGGGAARRGAPCT